MARHLIFGAGLIGCYLGASIQRCGERVDFVGRSSVAEKLKNNGLLISDYLGHKVKFDTVNFTSLDHESSQAEPEQCQWDYLWLTVKCTAIEQAVKQINPYVTANTTILCCQNGLGSESKIKEAFPEHVVLRVMVPFNVVEIKPGHFHRGSEGNLTVESLPNHESVDHELLGLSSDMMSIFVSSEMSALLWAKLQLNLSNAVNALADVPVKDMLEDSNYRKVIALLMSELLIVVKELGIELPKVTALPGRFIPAILRLPTAIFRVAAKKMLAIDPNVRTSMWWDISQGKLTEIAHLNGAVVRTAACLQIETPYNRRLVNLVRKVEAKEVGMGISGTELLRYVLNQ